MIYFFRFMSQLLLLSFVLVTPLASQSLRAYEKAGNSAFEEKDFGAAASYYATVLRQKPDKKSVLWKYAESNLNLQAYSEAEKSYQRIATDAEASAKYPLATFRLGQVKKSTGNYAAAIAYFQKYVDNAAHEDPANVELAKQEIALCTSAQALASSTDSKAQKVEITHLGKDINGPYNEFAPHVVGDTLFYSSYRFDKRVSRFKPAEKQAKVMFSLNGGRGKQPGKGFPATDSAHVANAAFSPDGRYMFFSVCENINAMDVHCELWFTAIDRRNRWLPPVRLPEPINLKGYSQTQPSIGYDSTFQGPVLWFSSDRPGGKGKFDLWYLPLDTNFYCTCNLPVPGKQLGRLPRFEDPINAADVNTSADEKTPFFSAADQKIYFSSEGWQGLGGFDVFSAVKSGEQFSEPENMGFGINTSYNDLYFFLKKDNRNGYLSSNRPGSYYLDEKNKACCNDIFSFKLPPPPTPQAKEPQPVPEPLAEVVPKTPPIAVPTQAPSLAPPPKIKDFVGLPLYFDNDEPEKRTRKTRSQLAYGETVSSYLEQQNPYRDAFSKGLKGDKEASAMDAVDDFFEEEVRKGAEKLNQLSEMILQRAQQGERIEVVIKGFTSPRAKSDYNLALGQRRVSSVINHFERYADGALQSYINSGHLVLREANFGEATAKSTISDDLADLRNSVYHPDAARERRVEIVEIKIKE